MADNFKNTKKKITDIIALQPIESTKRGRPSNEQSAKMLTHKLHEFVSKKPINVGYEIIVKSNDSSNKFDARESFVDRTKAFSCLQTVINSMLASNVKLQTIFKMQSNGKEISISINRN